MQRAAVGTSVGTTSPSTRASGPSGASGSDACGSAWAGSGPAAPVRLWRPAESTSSATGTPPSSWMRASAPSAPAAGEETCEEPRASAGSAPTRAAIPGPVVPPSPCGPAVASTNRSPPLEPSLPHCSWIRSVVAAAPAMSWPGSGVGGGPPASAMCPASATAPRPSFASTDIASINRSACPPSTCCWIRSVAAAAPAMSRPASGVGDGSPAPAMCPASASAARPSFASTIIASTNRSACPPSTCC